MNYLTQQPTVGKWAVTAGLTGAGRSAWREESRRVQASWSIEWAAAGSRSCLWAGGRAT